MQKDMLKFHLRAFGVPPLGGILSMLEFIPTFNMTKTQGYSCVASLRGQESSTIFISSHRLTDSRPSELTELPTP
jgi:hypothetical protein